MKNIFKICLIISSIYITFVFMNWEVRAINFDSTFELIPDNPTLTAQCLHSLKILISSPSQNSNAANVIINFDPEQIDIIDASASSAGTQIFPGTAYDLYADNIVNSSKGQIRLTGFSVESSFVGTDIFGIIKFRTKENIETVNLDIEFFGQGETLDSNIADTVTSDDTLQKGDSLILNVTEGSCGRDTTPPTIEPIEPRNYAPNVSPNSDVTLKICDSESGVDLKSVEVRINSQLYNYKKKKSFSYIQEESCYKITINPPQNFTENSPVLMIVHASDLQGNNAASSYVFNVPPDSAECYDQLTQTDKDLKLTEEKLKECLEKSDLSQLPETGIFKEFDINNIFSLIALIIIIIHPFWRNSREDDPLHKLFSKIYVLVSFFAIGLLLSILATINNFNVFHCFVLSLYILTAIYKTVLLARKKGRKSI